MSKATTFLGGTAAIAVGLLLVCTSHTAVSAQETTTIHISVRNQKFEPSEIRVPANKPAVLRIKNLDSKAIEFESVALRVEKVVAPNTEGVINLRPLKPGHYKFFDDFNTKATGTLIAE